MTAIAGNVSETYIAALGKLRPTGRIWLITRSRSPMKYLDGIEWHPELSPSWDILNLYKNGRIDWEGYTKRFWFQLRSTPAARESLEILKTSTEPIVLVCFEKEPPCHRFLILDWLSKERAARN